MKVKELIEILQTCDPDLEVKIQRIFCESVTSVVTMNSDVLESCVIINYGEDEEDNED